MDAMAVTAGFSCVREWDGSSVCDCLLGLTA